MKMKYKSLVGTAAVCGVLALLLIPSTTLGKPTCPGNSCKPRPTPTIAPTPAPTPVPTPSPTPVPTPSPTPTSEPTPTPFVLAITDVSAYDITPTEAKITWTVNAPATGQVEYGVTGSYGLLSTLETSFIYTTHIQQLSNLNPGTPYHYRTHSVDSNGSEAYSTDYTFTTLNVAPTPTPTLQPPGSYTIPTSIDSTGTMDVSGELGAFLASVSDSSTVTFSSGAIYRLDTPIILTDRHDLTLVGNGVTLTPSGINFVRGTGLTITGINGHIGFGMSDIILFYGN